MRELLREMWGWGPQEATFESVDCASSPIGKARARKITTYRVFALDIGCKHHILGAIWTRAPSQLHEMSSLQVR
ncbi:MAG: hypothetical protein ACI8TQ_002745 [Planctomycetota bacterium]|jgi:hypothetical protein